MRTKALLLLFTLLTIAAACTEDNGNPAEQELAAATITATCTGHASMPDTRAHIMDNFVDGDKITLTYYNRSKKIETKMVYRSGKWYKEDNPDSETIFINTIGNTEITAIYQIADTLKMEGMVYTDCLNATAKLGTDITRETNDSYTIHLKFAHTRALITVPTVNTLDGLPVPLKPGADVIFHVTESSTLTFRLLATPTYRTNNITQLDNAIALAGTELNSITFTTIDGITHTAGPADDTGKYILEAGKIYTPVVTTNENGATFYIPAQNIKGWEEGENPRGNYTHFINDLTSLIAFKNNVDADPIKGIDFRALQTADIELNSIWSSIPEFKGLYNGNGYKITGLGGDNRLFQLVRGAQLVNIHVWDADITGNTAPTGILANEAEDSKIALCSATGRITDGTTIGGLVGDARATYITRSRTNVTITGCHTGGGLVGSSEASNIVACMAAGSVSGETVGGLIGSSQASKFYFCYATSIPSGQKVGTLAGSSTFDIIKGCYSKTQGKPFGENSYTDLENCWWNDDSNSSQAEKPGLVVRNGPSIDVSSWDGVEFINSCTFEGSNVWIGTDDAPTLNYYNYTFQ